MNKKYVFIIFIFLIITSCVSFGRISGNEFINFDDNIFITENKYVQSGINQESIRWAFTTFHRSYWNPLTWLSHMMDWSLFGENAGGHHLVSLFFHIGASIFLFLFLNKTTNNVWPSAFAAAFFALHPLRVESVAWAAERKDVLSMFFAMTTLYTYAFYAENRRISKYLLCLVLFTLALMSKPMMVTLPFILILLDYWPLGRLDISSAFTQKTLTTIGRLLGEKIPFFILTAIVSAVAFWAQSEVGAMVNMENIPFTARLSNAVVSYTAYLGKTFWPVNLAVFYPFSFSVPLWEILICGILLVMISAFALLYIKLFPFLFTGWSLYLGTLVPVIGLVQVGDQAMADRYTYLPSVGLAIILAWGIPRLYKQDVIRQRILLPVAAVILMIMAILTWQQCAYWKTSITLSSRSLHVTRNNYKMYHNMGTAFFKEGKVNEAIYHFSKAITINPNYLSYNSRGEIYARAGRLRQAFDDFNKAIALNAQNSFGYYNRGLIYDRTGDYPSAIADYTKSIALKNDNANAYNNRGIVYAKTGQYERATQDFNDALLIKPDDAMFYNNRELVYFLQCKRKQKQQCVMRKKPVNAQIIQ